MTLKEIDTELLRYRDYLVNVKVPLLGAVLFKQHKFAYTDQYVPNSLWITQIPSFEEFKILEDEKGWGKSGEQSYLTISIYK